MRSRSSRHIHSRFRRSPAQAPCVVPGPLDPAREHRCTHQRRLWMVATALPCHSPPSFHLSYPHPPLQDLNSTLEFDRPLPYLLVIYLCIILFLIIVIPSVAFAPLNLRAFAHRPTSRRPKRPFLTIAAPSLPVNQPVAACRIGHRNDPPTFTLAPPPDCSPHSSLRNPTIPTSR